MKKFSMILLFMLATVAAGQEHPAPGSEGWIPWKDLIETESISVSAVMLPKTTPEHVELQISVRNGLDREIGVELVGTKFGGLTIGRLGEQGQIVVVYPSLVEARHGEKLILVKGGESHELTVKFSADALASISGIPFFGVRIIDGEQRREGVIYASDVVMNDSLNP